MKAVLNAGSPRRTLVTGVSRPLGVELVRQSLIRGDRVYACCRNPARVPVLADLRAEFGGLELLPLDPADASSVAEVIPVLESLTDSLDLVVIGPAEAGPHETLETAERDEHLQTLTGSGLTEHFRRHAVAPLLLVRTLLPWLARGDAPRVLVVNNWLASLSGKSQGGDYATCASGAALNMLARTMAHDLAEERVTVCIGNPGNYATSPDGPAFKVPIEDAALGMLMQTDRLPRDRTGAFLDWTGAERGW